MNVDREQLDLLLSRGSEAPLTDAERNVVERACAADASLATERDAYSRLNKMLADTRSLPANFDSTAAAATTQRMIRDEFVEADAEDINFDERLRDHVGDVPAIDWGGFHQRVSTAVVQEADARQPQTLSFPTWASWTAPLAAAAALVFILWGPVRPVENGSSKFGSPSPRADAIVVVEIERPTSGGLVEVSFDRSPPASVAAQNQDPLPGGTVIVNGTWPGSSQSSSTRIGGVSIDAYYY